jgi:hypothetical protein
MLLKEGGNLPIQKAIHLYLSQPGTVVLFEQLEATIRDMSDWHKHAVQELKGLAEQSSSNSLSVAPRYLQQQGSNTPSNPANSHISNANIGAYGNGNGNGNGNGKGSSFVVPPSAFEVVIDGDEYPAEKRMVLQFLQLLCEGHFEPNQFILCEQPNNQTSVNLLAALSELLEALDGFKCRSFTTASLNVSATILDAIQGPCERNQEYFAEQTKLIEILNRRLRSKPAAGCNLIDETKLKTVSAQILQGLLEGQRKP